MRDDGNGGIAFDELSRDCYEHAGAISECKGKGGSAPSAPDPTKTAQAQALANKEAVRESALVNQIRQRTPYGSVDFSGNIGSPDRTMTVALNPEGQSALDKQYELANLLSQTGIGRAQQISESPFSLRGARDLPSTYDTSEYEQASFDRAMSLLNPEFDRDRAQLEQRLANQGLPVGGEAYGSEWDILNRAQNEARNAAAWNAVREGASEQSRQFGLAQAGRQQDISDILLQRTQPMNELAAILQGSPALPSQQAPNVAQYQQAPADVQGSIWNNYNSRLNAYNQQQAQGNQMWSNIGSIAGTVGAMMLASDRNLKMDIIPVGSYGGHNWYEFEYIWGGGRRTGVMAQEVMNINPEAVAERNGYLVVDYGRI
jgi:hypothetical protein